MQKAPTTIPIPKDVVQAMNRSPKMSFAEAQKRLQKELGMAPSVVVQTPPVAVIQARESSP